MRLPKFSSWMALGAPAVAAALLGGCAENRSSLFIAGVLAFDLTSTDCKVEAKADALMNLGNGVVDLAVAAGGYSAPLLFGNQLTPQGSDDLLRSETSRIQLEGANITFSELGGGVIAQYRVAFSGMVSPEAGADAGYGFAAVPLVPTGLITDEGDYQVEVEAYGKTLGGTPVKSGKWTYPIYACTGCLAVCLDEEEPNGAASPCTPYGVDSPYNVCP